MRKGECDRCHRVKWINRVSFYDEEYCAECFELVNVPYVAPLHGVHGRSLPEDMSADQETAVRRMEDAG